MNRMHTIRKVKIPADSKILDAFLDSHTLDCLSLLRSIREGRIPDCYAGITKEKIRTLVTIWEGNRDITIWPSDPLFVSEILERWGPQEGSFCVGIKNLLEALKVYNPVKAFDEVFTMFVDKEHFIFKPKHKALRLKGDELPEPWLKSYEGIAYGIRVNSKVVSVGSVDGLIKGKSSCGAAIGTAYEHRNKGYATSALAYAICEALNNVPIVTYHAESNNMPALRVLERLGFRFHSSFLYTQVEKKKRFSNQL